MVDFGALMITAAQCKSIAQHYKTLASSPSISEDRAFLLRNIARSFVGVAGQLDRLEALDKGQASNGNLASQRASR
jgi:hypothetical protein